MKPGYLTTEGWFTFLIAIGGLVLGSGLLPVGTAVQVTALVVGALKAGFYTFARTSLKADDPNQSDRISMLEKQVTNAYSELQRLSDAKLDVPPVGVPPKEVPV